MRKVVVKNSSRSSDSFAFSRSKQAGLPLPFCKAPHGRGCVRCGIRCAAVSYRHNSALRTFDIKMLLMPQEHHTLADLLHLMTW
jgi:hypothetical protein